MLSGSGAPRCRRLYTGIVRRRSFALVFALLIAVGPAVAAVCELDCDQPPATSSHCHTAAARDGQAVRGTTHACGQVHLAESPALLTGISSRDQLVTCVAALSLCVERVSLPGPAAGTVVAMHDPPGLMLRSTNSLATVLRI
jgi:hypothetical protein